MNEAGLWRLFFLTGRPEIWLALRGEAQSRRNSEKEPVMTAFSIQAPGEEERRNMMM